MGRGLRQKDIIRASPLACELVKNNLKKKKKEKKPHSEKCQMLPSAQAQDQEPLPTPNPPPVVSQLPNAEPSHTNGHQKALKETRARTAPKMKCFAEKYHFQQTSS